MWISKAHYNTLDSLINSSQDRNTEMLRREGALNERVHQLEQQLMELKAERRWFMHRLTQVEMERGMMMQDRLGIKISVPAFVPSMEDPSEALSKVVDLSTVGGDAVMDTDADATQNPGIDYTNLPGYRGKR